MNKELIENREHFLKDLSKKLRRPQRDMNAPLERPPRLYQPEKLVFRGLNNDELLNIFENECKKILTSVMRTTKENLSHTLNEVIEEHGDGQIVAAKDERFQDFGLDHFLERDQVFVWNTAHLEENIVIAEKANIGIMFADMTLAESATMVVLNDKNKARAIGTLPKTFIGIIPLSSLLPRMTQAAIEIDRQVAAGEVIASCVNFISGPSNSADIEGRLVVGVHGPVKVSYIIVTDK